MKLKVRLRNIIKRVVYYSTITVICFVVLIGGWCIPPKLLEKVIDGMKLKFNTEFVLKDGQDRDIESP
jgi:hypothetical protein